MVKFPEYSTLLPTVHSPGSLTLNENAATLSRAFSSTPGRDTEAMRGSKTRCLPFLVIREMYLEDWPPHLLIYFGFWDYLGLREDLEHALSALENINFSSSEETTINLFEYTIRYLGGFLGAYEISDRR